MYKFILFTQNQQVWLNINQQWKNSSLLLIWMKGGPGIADTIRRCCCRSIAPLSCVCAILLVPTADMECVLGPSNKSRGSLTQSRRFLHNCLGILYLRKFTSGWCGFLMTKNSDFCAGGFSDTLRHTLAKMQFTLSFVFAKIWQPFH